MPWNCSRFHSLSNHSMKVSTSKSLPFFWESRWSTEFSQLGFFFLQVEGFLSLCFRTDLYSPPPPPFSSNSSGICRRPERQGERKEGGGDWKKNNRAILARKNLCHVRQKKREELKEKRYRLKEEICLFASIEQKKTIWIAGWTIGGKFKHL